MAKTGSYIKLDRGLKNNAIWLEKPFSKGQAWVDLLILAQGVDKEKLYRGKVQQMQHGNVYTSLYYLANRWGWSRSKVYRFLEELMFAEMIVIQGWTTNDTKNDTINKTKNKTKNGTVITVVNWEVYQYTETNDDTNNGSTNRKTKTKKTILTRERQRKKEKDTENNKGRSAPDSPSGKNDSHLRLKPEEGTVDDIPDRYRRMFDNFADYWRYRNS